MYDQRPEPSGHASNRWVQYADPDDDMQLAWDGALPLVDHGLHGDEARYCPKHDVILVRKDSEITTVIDHNDSTRWQAREAVSRAVELFGDEPIDRGD